MSKIISDKSKYVEYDETISKIVENIKKTETEKIELMIRYRAL